MARFILAADGSVLVERRVAPRYEVAVSVEINFGDGGDSVTGKTTNLSEDGVQVLTRALIPLGTTLQFSCIYFGGTMEAIWSRQENHQVRNGFRFVSLGRSDREALVNLLSSLRKHSTSVST